MDQLGKRSAYDLAVYPNDMASVSSCGQQQWQRAKV